MKSIVLLAIILIPGYVLVFAQGDKKPEFFAGYSYESVNTGVSSRDFSSTDTSLDKRWNVNGINPSAADYFSRRFGDYNPIFLRSRTFNSVTFPDRTLDGFRFSTGIVIK